ncbi:MAG: glycosyltransferase, partial [Burkholderiales bacterium]|nr:glycosyltransferase [Burkholderiales bacterium]
MADISIVTISFNQGAFLEQAINSVCAQEGVEVDYVIVDPGSTDGSREIIRRYSDRFAACMLDPDEGPADGLNKGFERTRAEVLGYLNADDLLLPGALRFACEFFRRHREIDVITGNGWVVDEHGRRMRRDFSDRFSLRAVAYDACVAVQPSTFFRRSAFARTGGFNVSNRSNWDGELLVDMAL